MIITSQNITVDTLSQVGGKAKNLAILGANGIKICPFGIVTDSEIFDIDNFKELVSILQLRTGQKVILRSSANVEDSSEYSFAGLLTSKIVECSFEAIAKGIEYLRENTITPDIQKYTEFKSIKTEIKLNIIIQPYENFSESGVVFSSNPQCPETGILINAAKGQPENVVNGKGCETMQIGYFEQPKKSETLTKRQVQKLLDAINTIKLILQDNMDIEFGFQGHNLFILQARPITTFSKNKRVLIDSSNIKENYPNQVLPLTYSILQQMYNETYFDLLQHSGVNQKTLYRHKSLFQNLLVNYRGSLFYNMGNWYKFSTLLPRSKQNNDSLKYMITGKTPDDLIHSRNHSIFSQLKYLGVVAKKLVYFNSSIKKYQNHIHRFLEVYQYTNFSRFSLISLQEIWHELGSIIDHETYINAENDFLLMYYLDKLRRSVGDENNIVSILQSISDQQQISSHQVTELVNIKAKIVDIGMPENPDEIYLSPKYREIRDEIILYIRSYNGRFPQELNLANQDTSHQTIKSVIDVIFDTHHKQSINAPLNNSKSTTKYTKNLGKYLKNREQNRLLRAQVFSVIRKLFSAVEYQLIQNNHLNDSGDIQYLAHNEIWDYINLNSINISLKELVTLRRKEYSATYPPIVNFGTTDFLDFYEGKVGQPPQDMKHTLDSLIVGTGCSEGEVEGQVIQYQKDKVVDYSNKIIIFKNIDPGMVSLISQAKGIIIEEGGILSHGAIIAREMRIPAIIGVQGVSNKVKDGQNIRLNGGEGKIHLL